MSIEWAEDIGSKDLILELDGIYYWLGIREETLGPAWKLFFSLGSFTYSVVLGYVDHGETVTLEEAGELAMKAIRTFRGEEP